MPAAAHPGVANKAQQQHKKCPLDSTTNTHMWISAAAQPRSAQGSSNTIRQWVRDKRDCQHNRRGKTQLKICRDLHSREYFSGMALTKGRPHPSLLLNTHCGSPKMLILLLWDCRVCSSNCTLQLCVWAGLGSAAPSVSRREAWDMPDHG